MATLMNSLLGAALLAVAATPAAAQAPSIDPFLPFGQQAEAVARAAECLPDRIDAPGSGNWKCAVGRADDTRTFIVQVARDPANPSVVRHVELHWSDAANDRAFQRRVVLALKSMLTALDAPALELVASAFMGPIPRALPGRWSGAEAQWADDRRGLKVEVLLAGNSYATQRRMRIEALVRTGETK